MIKRCQELIAECESAVRRLITEAALEGQYRTVERLAAVARELADLGANLTVRSSGPQSASASPPRGHMGAQPRGAKGPKRKKDRRKAYPKFLRQGDNLVKVGWSKKDKKEYIHKTSRTRVFCVVQAIAEAGRNGKKITSEEFIPLRNPQDDSDVPSYQVYAVLAWLLKIAVVKQHGRQGYTVLDASRLLSQVHEAWEALPTE